MTMKHGDATDVRTQPRGQWPWRVIAVLFLINALPGCVTPWEKYALMKDTTPNITKVQGPNERRMRNVFWAKRQEADADDSDDGSLPPLVGTDDYFAATELYKDEQYAEAQKAFKSVAKKYKKNDIREDALFMQGESAFQQQHYSKAHDTYAILLKEFPSTRHLDVVSERLFKIGRIWLDFPEVAKLDVISQVDFEEPGKRLPPEEPPKVNRTPVYVPNFTNKERPLFDAPGNGVAALQAIWMNDPTGPLADDAMMLVASHHARKGNYIEADRYFRMLRETFPNSPHLQDAFLIGSHVKLMSYQGSDYDGKTLTDAQMLKESTIRLYPNIPEADRLRDELAKIEAAKAEREWSEVQLWIRKGNKRAAAVKMHQLMSRFPDSSRAEQSRQLLAEMGPHYESGAVLLRPIDPPKGSIWKQAMGIRPEDPIEMPRRPNAAGKATYADSDKKEESPSRITKPFRKRTAPDSAPVESEEDSAMPDDGASAESSDKEPRKRSWRWPAPRKLPEESDINAKKLEANEPSGKADLFD
jgi:TolA-binding protein